MRAAAVSHAFAGIELNGRPAMHHTKGNPDCHIILRGGRGAPNYASATVADALRRLAAAGLPERLVVDASHDNSGKDHRRQPEVVSDVAQQVAAGNGAIVGVMLESFLEEGRQELRPGGANLTYGQSVTDPCMSWDQTVGALDELAGAVRERRTRA